MVIEPTGAQPPAGKTQPGIDEPTGGNPTGDTKPGSEEKPGDETKPSENPPLTPDSSPKSDAKPAPASIKTPATKTTKKTKPATTQAAALPKTGHGDWRLRALPSSSRYVVGHHKSSGTSLGTLFDNVVSAASFPHFSESIMQIA